MAKHTLEILQHLLQECVWPFWDVCIEGLRASSLSQKFLR